MNAERRVAIGIAWYRREQWSLLLCLIPDPEVFPHTYDEWLAKAEDTLRQANIDGVVAKKVDVDVKELIAWAESRDRAPDGAARAEYASYKLKADDEKGSS